MARLLTEQQLIMQTKNATRNISVQTSALEVSKEQLKLAERVFYQTEAKFKEGVIGSTDLILAENGLQEAQTNVVSTYIKLRQAELEYLKILGEIR